LTVETLESERINKRIEVTPDDDLVSKFDALEANDVIVISGGVHEISEPLQKRNIRGVTVRGQGILTTHIKRTGNFPIFDLATDEGHGHPKMGKWTFAGFRLAQNEHGPAPVFRAHDVHHNRLANVQFTAWGEEADSTALHASRCFDWKCYGCHWGRAGNPTENRAEIYMENETNNFHFVDCKWERLHSYAILSHTNPTDNARHRLVNCKMHGAVGENRPETTVPFIAGHFKKLQIANSKFGPALDGFFRLRGERHPSKGLGGILIANNDFAYHNLGSSPAIELLENNRLAVVNNDFTSKHTEHPAVAVRDGIATITGNMTYWSPVAKVTGGSATITGNSVQKPPTDGIRVQSDNTAVLGNRIERGDIRATSDSSGVVATGNVVTDGSIELAGSDSQRGVNVVR
jgi:hypothetical protein